MTKSLQGRLYTIKTAFVLTGIRSTSRFPGVGFKTGNVVNHK